MARVRMLKPGFFTNEDLGACAPLTRLFFEGLWCWADRDGRLEDRPRRLVAEILPYDREADGEAMLSDLAERGFVVRYSVGPVRVVQIVNFAAHQNPHPRESPGKLPPVPGSSEAMPRPTKGEPGVEQGTEEPGGLSDSRTLRETNLSGAASAPAEEPAPAGDAGTLPLRGVVASKPPAAAKPEAKRAAKEASPEAREKRATWERLFAADRGEPYRWQGAADQLAANALAPVDLAIFEAKALRGLKGVGFARCSSLAALKSKWNDLAGTAPGKPQAAAPAEPARLQTRRVDIA